MSLNQAEPPTEQSVAVIDTPPLVPPIEDAAPDETADAELEFGCHRNLRRAPSAAAEPPRRKTAAHALGRIGSCSARLQRGDRGAPHDVVRVPAANRLAVRRHRHASQLRQLEFESVKISKDAPRRRADRARRDRQHGRQADRGSAPAHFCAQRHRAGNLYVDGAAEPQHPRSRRAGGVQEPADVTAGGRPRHDRALLQGAKDAAAASTKLERMAKVLIAEDDETVRALVIRALSEDGHALTATADGARSTRSAQRTTANSTCY